jgi:hypothetical protein
MSLIVPEPQRLLEQWAEKYRERYRWRLRSSFQANNPLGRELSDINQGLQSTITTPYIFSGAIAASDAPFVDIDQVEVFLAVSSDDRKLRELKSEPNPGPKFRFTDPYDGGVSCTPDVWVRLGELRPSRLTLTCTPVVAAT